MAKSCFSLTIVVAVAGLALSIIFQPTDNISAFAGKTPTTTSAFIR